MATINLESHMRFICPECGGDHETQSDWRKHLNQVHQYLNKTIEDFGFKEINDRYHECQECKQWVANGHHTMALLQYHHFLHLPFSRTYRCKYCGNAFTRKRALCDHLHRFHPNQVKRNPSNVITKPSTDNKSGKDPKNNPEFYMRFLCPQCGKAFSLFQHWLQHLDLAHSATSTDLKIHQIMGSKNHYCLVCKKLLPTDDRSKLRRHRFSHLPYKTYFQCVYCLVTRNSKSEMLRHFFRAHRKEFDANKQYVRKPVEWAGNISERLNNELDEIMREIQRTTESADARNDIIQQALMESLIDFENESRPAVAQASVMPAKKSANEYALDQSLNDLEAILRCDVSDMNPSSSLIAMTTIEMDNDELEDVCNELFEEIINDDSRMDEEKIICIEIDAVKTEVKGDGEQSPSEPPSAKRIKLNKNDTRETQVKSASDEAALKNNVIRTHHKDVRRSNKNEKSLLETYINYLCPECGVPFETQQSWRDHIFSKHNPRNVIKTNFRLQANKASYLCLDCWQVQNTTKFSELQRHRFTHTPFNSYLKCRVCGKRRSTKPKIIQHLENFHPELTGTKPPNHRPLIEYKCNTCARAFYTPETGKRSCLICVQRDSVNNSKVSDNLALLAHLKEANKRMQRILDAEGRGNMRNGYKFK